MVIGRSPCGRRRYIAQWSSDRRAVAYRRPKGHLQVITRWVSFYTRRRISVRSPVGVPSATERRAANLRSAASGFFSWFFGRWPMGRRAVAGRCPAGRRRMSELPKTSRDHPPNFSCKLKLLGRQPISRRWGLCRRITTAFFTDGKQNSSLDHRAIDFSVLGRRL